MESYSLLLGHGKNARYSPCAIPPNTTMQGHKSAPNSSRNCAAFNCSFLIGPAVFSCSCLFLNRPQLSSCSCIFITTQSWAVSLATCLTIFLSDGCSIKLMLLSLLCAQDKVTWGLQLYIAQKGRSLHARTIDKKRGAVVIRELFK